MYYDYYETGLIGTLTLAGDEMGLRHIFLPKKKNTLSIPDTWKKKPGFFGPVKAQLRKYFRGELRRFDVPLAPLGSPFQLKVWNALGTIPYGKLVSYKDVAESIGNHKAARAVGGATGKNPIPIIVPCHRVIGSDGSLTGFGGGLETKKRLIELEQAKQK